MYNVLSNVEKDLEVFHDQRGSIADIFYGKTINHVARIFSVRGSIRGNHYHRHTIQHTLVLSGSMEYWARDIECQETSVVLVCPLDVVTSLQNEVHAMKFLDDSVILVFSEGVRGGQDYEKDTYRVESIIP